MSARTSIALLALALWILVTPLAGGSLAFPVVVAAVWAALERVLVLNPMGRAWRLVALSAYGVLGTLVQAVIVPAQSTGFLYDDEAFYHEAGRVIAEGGQTLDVQGNAWGEVIGWVYRMLGVNMIHVRGLSALAGVILLAVVVDAARHLTNDAAARRLYWLAGASPVLLVWVVGGIRDLTIGVGVALVVVAAIVPRGRTPRFILGVVLIIGLRPLMLAFAAAVVAIGLLQTFVRGRRPITTLAFGTATAFVVYRWGIALGRNLLEEQVSIEARQFIATRVQASESSLAVVQGLIPQWGLLGIIPAIVVTVFSPIWFAVVAPGTPSALVAGIGGLAWWAMLPSVVIGMSAARSSRSMTTVAVWGGGAIVAGATTLLTVFQDPARMRIVGLGAFFILATWAIEVRREQVMRWTKRWAIVNIMLVALYVVVKAGLTSFFLPLPI